MGMPVAAGLYPTFACPGAEAGEAGWAGLVCTIWFGVRVCCAAEGRLRCTGWPDGTRWPVEARGSTVRLPEAGLCTGLVRVVA